MWVEGRIRETCHCLVLALCAAIGAAILVTSSSARADELIDSDVSEQTGFPLRFEKRRMSLADFDALMKDALGLDSAALNHWTGAIRPRLEHGAAPERQNVMVVRSYSDLPVLLVGDGGVNGFAIIPSETEGGIDPNVDLKSYCDTDATTRKRCVPLTWDHVQNRPCLEGQCTPAQPGVAAVFIAARNIVVHGTVPTRGLSLITMSENLVMDPGALLDLSARQDPAPTLGVFDSGAQTPYMLYVNQIGSPGVPVDLSSLAQHDLSEDFDRWRFPTQPDLDWLGAHTLFPFNDADPHVCDEPWWKLRADSQNKCLQALDGRGFTGQFGGSWLALSYAATSLQAKSHGQPGGNGRTGLDALSDESFSSLGASLCGAKDWSSHTCPINGTCQTCTPANPCPGGATVGAVCTQTPDPSCEPCAPVDHCTFNTLDDLESVGFPPECPDRLTCGGTRAGAGNRQGQKGGAAWPGGEEGVIRASVVTTIDACGQLSESNLRAGGDATEVNNIACLASCQSGATCTADPTVTVCDTIAASTVEQQPLAPLTASPSCGADFVFQGDLAEGKGGIAGQGGEAVPPWLCSNFNPHRDHICLVAHAPKSDALPGLEFNEIVYHAVPPTWQWPDLQGNCPAPESFAGQPAPVLSLPLQPGNYCPSVGQFAFLDCGATQCVTSGDCAPSGFQCLAIPGGTCPAGSDPDHCLEVTCGLPNSCPSSVGGAVAGSDVLCTSAPGQMGFTVITGDPQPLASELDPWNASAWAAALDTLHPLELRRRVSVANTRFKQGNLTAAAARYFSTRNFVMANQRESNDPTVPTFDCPDDPNALSGASKKKLRICALRKEIDLRLNQLANDENFYGYPVNYIPPIAAKRDFLASQASNLMTVAKQDANNWLLLGDILSDLQNHTVTAEDLFASQRATVAGDLDVLDQEVSNANQKVSDGIKAMGDLNNEIEAAHQGIRAVPVLGGDTMITAGDLFSLAGIAAVSYIGGPIGAAVLAPVLNTLSDSGQTILKDLKIKTDDDQAKCDQKCIDEKTQKSINDWDSKVSSAFGDLAKNQFTKLLQKVTSGDSPGAKDIVNALTIVTDNAAFKLEIRLQTMHMIELGYQVGQAVRDADLAAQKRDNAILQLEQLDAYEANARELDTATVANLPSVETQFAMLDTSIREAAQRIDDAGEYFFLLRRAVERDAVPGDPAGGVSRLTVAEQERMRNQPSCQQEKIDTPSLDITLANVDCFLDRATFLQNYVTTSVVVLSNILDDDDTVVPFGEWQPVTLSTGEAGYSFSLDVDLDKAHRGNRINEKAQKINDIIFFLTTDPSTPSTQPVPVLLQRDGHDVHWIGTQDGVDVFQNFDLAKSSGAAGGTPLADLLRDDSQYFKEANLCVNGTVEESPAALSPCTLSALFHGAFIGSRTGNVSEGQSLIGQLQFVIKASDLPANPVDFHARLMYDYHCDSAATPSSSHCGVDPIATEAFDTLSFEQAPSNWAVVANGAPTRGTASAVAGEGRQSLSVPADNWTTITSPRLSSATLRKVAVGPDLSKISYALLIPTTQPNPYWIGATQMYLSAPSANVFNAYLGEVELTGQPQGRFVRQKFTVPSDALRALTEDHEDVTLTIVLNVNAGTPPWLVDDLRIGQ